VTRNLTNRNLWRTGGMGPTVGPDTGGRQTKGGKPRPARTIRQTPDDLVQPSRATAIEPESDPKTASDQPRADYLFDWA
jgi:hypothetical protein